MAPSMTGTGWSGVLAAGVEALGKTPTGRTKQNFTRALHMGSPRASLMGAREKPAPAREGVTPIRLGRMCHSTTRAAAGSHSTRRRQHEGKPARRQAHLSLHDAEAAGVTAAHGRRMRLHHAEGCIRSCRSSSRAARPREKGSRESPVHSHSQPRIRAPHQPKAAWHRIQPTTQQPESRHGRESSVYALG